ncbi:MAG: PIN domain-containing protein [Syntrophaceae bacterium]|nr:PIN domain-containing protein [Syntrophaceae bacterium]
MSDILPKLIDANFILRYLLRDDEKLYEQAYPVLERAKTGEEKILILESVLTECVYVLLKIYRVEREIIAAKMRELISYRGVVNSDQKDLAEAARLFGKTDLSFVDCLLCAKSHLHKFTLLTFDKELMKYCA